MKDTRAYWSLRLALGVGVWLLLFAGVVMAAGGPSAAMDAVEEEGISLVPVLVGAVLGTVWENFIAAGAASYIVYGSVHIGSPPMYESPRPRFTDTSLNRRY